jgi:hypothetical protein
MAPVDYTDQIIVMAITFAVSAAVSVWLSKRISELED